VTIKAWKGPSTIDGNEIMAVVSCEKRKSVNDKTGDMIQVAFFRTDQPPLEAVHSGDDESVCGSCPIRPSVHDKSVTDLPCYVNVMWTRAQWNAGMNAPEDLDQALDVLGKKPVRFGQYGNMSSIPKEVALEMFKAADKWTLYEHEWRKPENLWMREYAMASVHSIEEAKEAWALGFRTFRTVNGKIELEGNEILCPNTTHGKTCEECLLCDGKRKKRDNRKRDNRKSIVVRVHGKGRKKHSTTD